LAHRGRDRHHANSDFATSASAFVRNRIRGRLARRDYSTNRAKMPHSPPFRASIVPEIALK